mgnify:CR=1 FL=1
MKGEKNVEQLYGQFRTLLDAEDKYGCVRIALESLRSGVIELVYLYEDVLRRAVIQSLMCQDVVDMKSIGERFGIDFESHFASELGAMEGLEADGLVELGEQTIRVTAKGRFLLRPIAMTFDAYLPPERQPGRFSKVI